MSFESELENGNFCIPECINCKNIVWPPTDFCTKCFGKISLKRGDFEGKIVEFSKKDNDFFCVVEFSEKIRIMAKMIQTPNIGDSVKISKCGIENGNYFFHVN